MSYRIQLGELDISEEAEELREFLYDIVSGYPSGIDSGLLEKLYVEKYVETSIARSLPKDWLHQLQLAGEFEVKSIGGLTTVYIVHKGVVIPPQLEQVSHVVELEKVEISQNIVPESAPKNEKPSEEENVYENSNVAEILSVENNCKYCYVRFHKRKLEFNNFLIEIAQFYTEHHKDADLYVENPALNQAYVVLDTTGNWCRVIVKETLDQSAILPCFFVDYGEIRSMVRRSLKKLDNAFSFENYPAFAVCCAANHLKTDVRSLPHLLNTISQTQLKKLELTQMKIEITSHVSEGNYNIVKFEDDSGKSQSIEYLKNSKPLVSKASSLPPPVPAAKLNIVCREPQEMSKKKEIIHIISATDPDNISIQFAAWHPAPAYLSAAMTRDSENSQPPPKEQVKEGNYYAAKLDDGWERVQVIRPSTTLVGGDYWVVYAIDVGNFHLVHWKQLRFLTESVSSFNKILLAKCKLNGIKSEANGTWSRELQQAMQDLLQSVDKSTVEFEPIGKWTKHSTFSSPFLPYATGQLLIDGKNFADQLISLGLAQKQ